MPIKLSLDEYNNLFHYDETSPTFLCWKIDCFSGRNYTRKHICAGQPAGSLNGTDGYSQVHYKKGMYRVHRIIWEMFNGDVPEGYVIDHMDGNPANNHITNLRAVEEKYNSRNKKKQHNNTSGVVGVTAIFYKNPADVVYKYYKAEWSNFGIGKQYKTFSVLKLGEEEAFRLACEYRAKMIEELNEQGAGYSKRHGT